MGKNNKAVEMGLAAVARAYGHYFGDETPLANQEDWLYITDCETYDLKLVLNNTSSSFPDADGDWQGKKCYEYIEHRSSPCEGCAMKNIRSDNFYSAICRNSASGADIFTKDVRLDWGGRPCKLQTVFDITDHARRDELLSEYLQSRNIMSNILCQLMEDKPADIIFRNICAEIGRFFDADRVIITEYRSGKINSEWTRDGQPFEQVCTEMSSEGIKALTEATENLRYVWVSDMETAENVSEPIKKYWLSCGVKSILFIPMHYNGEFIGTLSLHNFRSHASQVDSLSLIALSVAKNIYSTIIESTSELQLYTDPLTGALNLAGFKKRSYELIAKNPDVQYAFCVSDIRYFSGINRRFSYALGDRILSKTAELLYEILDEDEAYCRIAADQFCFITKFASKESFDRRFYSFVDRMQCFAPLTAANVKIEYQAGVYIPDGRERSISISRAIDKANIARKTLKDYHGSGYAFFSSKMLEESRREVDLIQDFKIALDSGEITVYFQPQWNYTSNNLSGAEALVRWISGKHGFVSPAEFIPILERNGLVYDLDKYVWELVCKNQRIWMDKGYRCPISINVSRYDMLREGMCEELDALLNRYGIPKELMPLEITETAYTKNSEELVNVVDRLKAAGFIVEMDDFGSGYSSLNALKDVAVDLLKLDMKFLDSGTEGGRSGSILSCIVRMARWLNIPVLAEGVETVGQAEYLKNIGCDLMQGYYFARPMPADSFEEILKRETSGGIAVVKQPEQMSEAAFMASIVANPTFFNLIGSAAIVEYDGDECEALLINDSFFETLGCTREEYAPYMNCMHRYSVDVLGHTDAARVFRKIVDEEMYRDFILRQKDSSERSIRLVCRKLLSDSGRQVLLLTLDDLSKYVNN